MPIIELNNITPLLPKHYAKPYNKLRMGKLIIYDHCLSSHDEYKIQSYVERLELMEHLERACYNCTIDKAHENNIKCSWHDEHFVDLYHSICYKISSNLEKNPHVNNNYLCKVLFNKTISIDALPKLASHELLPEIYVDILDRYYKSKNMSLTIKTTSMYKCKKCYQSKCQIENRYNRSADEGVNISILCMNCGNSWNG